VLEKGVFNTFNVPNATRTAPHDINDRGQIVGAFVDAGGVLHGFLLDAGMFTTIDLPGAVETDPAGINDRSEIVGAIDDTQGVTHGFFRDRRGRFSVIDVPGAGPFTSLFGINNRREIVGQYLPGLPARLER